MQGQVFEARVQKRNYFPWQNLVKKVTVKKIDLNPIGMS
jgi:hypothetical protein